MTLNLWFEDQEGPFKIYGGGPWECSENIYQHCTYLALTANGILWPGGSIN